MNKESVTLTGSSGSTYRFAVYPWSTNFNPVGAVYAILRKEFSSSNYTILYIGQTGDLSDRFNGHHKQHCFDKHRKTHIGVHVERSESRRLAIESDLLCYYKTACNF